MDMADYSAVLVDIIHDRIICMPIIQAACPKGRVCIRRE
jgi:hypothetical protein